MNAKNSRFKGTKGPEVMSLPFGAERLSFNMASHGCCKVGCVHCSNGKGRFCVPPEMGELK